MSANADLLRRVYDAWNRKDVEGGLALVHPEIEFHSSGEFPGLAPVYQGREGMRRFWEDLAGFWEVGLEVRSDEMTELPDGRLLALNTFVGHAREGMTVERETAQIVRIEDGLVTSMVTFGSWEAARAAAEATRRGT